MIALHEVMPEELRDKQPTRSVLTIWLLCVDELISLSQLVLTLENRPPPQRSLIALKAQSFSPYTPRKRLRISRVYSMQFTPTLVSLGRVFIVFTGIG